MNMKASKIRIFQTAIIVTILSCMLCSYASAATARSSKYLNAYGVYLTPVGNGKVVITVDVDALHTMTKIGATKIYLYESSDGKNFNLVRTYRYEDYPIMMSSGKHYYQDLFTYYGTAGYSYHALAYCYAGDSTGYDEKLFSTATKKAT